MFGRSKIIMLDDRFAKTGEPTVQPVVLWGLRGKPCYETLSKEASASPALDYIRHVQPTPGHTVVLILGLGSYEYYGLNRNGDGFNEQPYKPGQSNGSGRDSWVMEKECIQHHYHTYEQGHVYRHHQNKDTAKAIGKVLKAFWNPFMHRVEVLEDLDNTKAPDLAQQIADGEYPAKSMGCFPAGTWITTEDGFCTIQQIDPGMRVLTHTGQWRPVTETHRRPYRGKLYCVHTPTGDSSATAEHPYGVLPRESVEEWYTAKSYWRRKSLDQINIESIDWRHAECLETGDYLVTPFDTAVQNTLTEDQCRLLGYYVAEGHPIFQRGELYGLEFNHHINDVAADELPELFQRLVPNAPWHQNDRTNSKHAQATTVYDWDLARFCVQHAGQYARAKHLSRELMQQAGPQQLAFLGAWINGDGGTTSTGAFYVCSCNDLLMRQAQIVGFRCGLYGRHHSIVHKPSTIVDKVTTEYRVDFARRGCDIIAPHTAKVTKRAMRGASTGPFFIEGAVVSKITDISVFDFEGDVYNFEVEEDESYVAEGHAVHNCRIKVDVCTRCGNMAPTRRHYCDHLKFEMSRLGDDGLRNGALNPSPRFFDSSWVLRPADRTGYLLKKVAEENTRPYELWSSSDLGDYVDHLTAKAAAAHKLAVIDKVVRGYPAAMVQGDLPEAGLIAKYRDSTLPTVVAGTPELSGQDLASVQGYNLADTLSALSRVGIILTTPEFIQLFMQKAAPGVLIPRGLLDRITAMQGELFELYSKNPSLLDQSLSSFASSANKTAGLDAQIYPLLEKRSTVSEYLYRRLVPAEIQGGQRPPLSELLEVPDPESGRIYQTTRGAAQDAHDELAKAELTKMLGGAALLGGAYKVLTMSPKLRPFKLPIGAGLGYAGYKGLAPDLGPTYESTTGESVPYLTEFVEKQSSYIDVVNTLGQDYRVSAGGPQRFNETLQKAAAHGQTPFYLLLRKVASFGVLPLNGLVEHVSRFKHASDGIVEEQLDFDKVAEVIGNLVWDRLSD